MTITFVSAFFNHHQILLGEELRKHCSDFYYISTMPVPQERIDFGYEDIEKKYSYVIRAYDGSTEEKEIEDILLRSDAVIFGECDNKYIELRMKENKLSFLYSERFFKKGTWRRFIPQTRKKIENRVIKYKNKNLYILCASAFLSNDLRLLGFDVEKCFKWGYFPQVKNYLECPIKCNETPHLLWVGRMIGWKHPHHAIEIAARIKKKGYDFTLDMIGGGECEDELKALASKLSVADRIRFLGSMSPQNVADYMEQSDVLLMTSDYCEGWGAVVNEAMSPQNVADYMEQSDVLLMTSDYCEGWGAVVNEAMSAGCAVLASSAAGSVPFLIRDGENGIIYRYGDMDDFENKLQNLLKDAQLRRNLGMRAFYTIKNEYNQKVAVERLMEFIKNDCKKKDYPWGPMSAAPVVENKWYKV